VKNQLFIPLTPALSRPGRGGFQEVFDLLIMVPAADPYVLPSFFPKINHSSIALSISADRKVSGGVQKLYFCMGQPGDAAVQKYSFCTPGQP
jgi:hypothetical protein